MCGVRTGGEPEAAAPPIHLASISQVVIQWKISIEWQLLEDIQIKKLARDIHQIIEVISDIYPNNCIGAGNPHK